MHYTGVPLQTHVTAAKAGVDALAVQIGIEYGPLGITSNVIAPGGIADTEGMDRLASPATLQEKAVRSTVPLQRQGLIKDIVDAAVWLFSDAANYVNCETVVVDGGAWRTFGASPGAEFRYPDFLLGGEQVKGVKGGKREKGKL